MGAVRSQKARKFSAAMKIMVWVTVPVIGPKSLDEALEVAKSMRWEDFITAKGDVIDSESVLVQIADETAYDGGLHREL